jgi:bacillithiol biosynthesis cysteine-adding enzyme BshC
MKATSIPRNLTNCFSEQQLLISNHQKSLEDFIEKPFSKEAFSSQIELKSKNYLHSNRKLLQSVLISKYSELDNNAQVLKNIEKLSDENCYTITTGHQLSLLSGPIYFIYKILHVIKQCEELKKIHPNYHFVPVFWMASEDHDFEEIKSISLFGKSLSWKTEQSGAVGRMNLSELQHALDDFKELFNNTFSTEIFDLVSQMVGKTYGEAFFRFIHYMFSEFGLVIIDGDQKEFKKSFSRIMKLEIETQFSYQAVIQTNEKLTKSNFKIQVNPREINLFYLSEMSRDRILKIDSGFRIGNKLFSKSDILALIDSEPECFSPNVILRPLYQEFLLPNLCYIGGTSELNYWLQLKKAFESAEIHYPLIQARVSALLLDNVSAEKIQKFKLKTLNLFQSLVELKKQVLLELESENIDFQLIDFQFAQLKNDFLAKSNQIDPAHNSRVGAEFTKIEKQLTHLKFQLEKSIKNKHEKTLIGLEQLKNKLFPNDELQERNINFFQFCPDGKFKDKLHDLKKLIQPFDSDFLILENGEIQD